MSLVSLPPSGPVPELWRTHLKYKGKELVQNPFNVKLFLEHHTDYKGFLRWNALTLRVEIVGGPIHADCKNPSNLDEIATAAIDHMFAKHDLSCGRDEFCRRLVSVALSNQYDPVVNYLNSVVWDNVPRLNKWLATYCHAEDTLDGYLEFVGRKWLLSTVARAFKPGCKVDVVLVAEGDQGHHKSTMLRILGGEGYRAASGVLGDKDSKQLIGAAWIVELPDMASFSKSERNTMKAFFTDAEDSYRPPFAKDHIHTKRRAVFAATTNDEEYLADPTGNRRFWPILLKMIERAMLVRDRDQLFAEAVALYKAAYTCPDCKSAPVVIPGEENRCPKHSWWLSTEEQEIARLHSQDREEYDSWTVPVLTWAKNPIKNEKAWEKDFDPLAQDTPNGLLDLTTANVLEHALKFQLKDITRADEMRVSAVLRRAGYTRSKRGSKGTWWPPKAVTPT